MLTFLREFGHNIVSSESNPFRAVRRAIYCLIVFTALAVLLIRVTLAGTSEAVTNRDIIQDYVMGRAIVHGVDYRLPIPDLVGHFLGQGAASYLPHPSPHSPLLSLVFIPFSLLPLEVANQLWVVVCAGCGMVAFFALADMAGVKHRWLTALLWCSLSLLSYPGRTDLLFGQWGFPQMLLLALFLRSYERGLFRWSAAYLSLALALRPILIPVGLYLLVASHKRFRVTLLLSAGALVGLLWATLGVHAILSYPEAAAEALRVWEGVWVNISLRSFVANIAIPRFGQLSGNLMSPISPGPLAPEFGAIGMLLAIGLGLSSVVKARNREPRYAILSLLVISPLVSPIAWEHYLLILFIPLFLDGARLLHHPRPRARLVLGAMIVALVYPVADIFAWVVVEGPSEVPRTVLVPWIGRLVYPVLTISVVLAWALYPLPKRVDRELPLDR